MEPMADEHDAMQQEHPETTRLTPNDTVIIVAHHLPIIITCAAVARFPTPGLAVRWRTRRMCRGAPWPSRHRAFSRDGRWQRNSGRSVGAHARAPRVPARSTARSSAPRSAFALMRALDSRLTRLLPVPIGSRTADGGYNVEWDDDRGLNRDGMNLPVQCIYIGCIDMEVGRLFVAGQELRAPRSRTRALLPCRGR